MSIDATLYLNQFIIQHSGTSHGSGLAPVPDWAARTLLLYITLRHTLAKYQIVTIINMVRQPLRRAREIMIPSWSIKVTQDDV